MGALATRLWVTSASRQRLISVGSAFSDSDSLRRRASEVVTPLTPVTHGSKKPVGAETPGNFLAYAAPTSPVLVSPSLADTRTTRGAVEHGAAARQAAAAGRAGLPRTETRDVESIMVESKRRKDGRVCYNLDSRSKPSVCQQYGKQANELTPPSRSLFLRRWPHSKLFVYLAKADLMQLKCVINAPLGIRVENPQLHLE